MCKVLRVVKYELTQTFYFSMKPKNLEEKMVPADRPFLLLDIRPAEQYESGHIVSARSYPHVRLARAVNFETTEMLAYKVCGNNIDI